MRGGRGRDKERRVHAREGGEEGEREGGRGEGGRERERERLTLIKEQAKAPDLTCPFICSQTPFTNYNVNIINLIQINTVQPLYMYC